MKDPEYPGRGARSSASTSIRVSGTEIDELLAELYATPKHVIEKASQAMAK